MHWRLALSIRRRHMRSRDRDLRAPSPPMPPGKSPRNCRSQTAALDPQRLCSLQNYPHPWRLFLRHSTTCLQVIGEYRPGRIHLPLTFQWNDKISDAPAFQTEVRLEESIWRERRETSQILD